MVIRLSMAVVLAELHSKNPDLISNLGNNS